MAVFGMKVIPRYIYSAINATISWKNALERLMLKEFKTEVLTSVFK